MVKDILELAEAVKAMRTAQKEAKRTGAGIAKAKAEKMEKDVDRMIEGVVIPARASQNKMF